MSAPRVVLYSRDGCHLCGPARDVVAQVCADAGASWSEIDIDTDPDLIDRYGELLPVVTVDGAQVGYWWINEERLRAALAGGERRAD